jgi:hypothetical protein
VAAWAAAFASLVLLAALAASALAAAADLTRPQALAQLEADSPPARREAIVRLGEIGTMPDVQPLIRALRDPDEEARARAERAIWRIWSRSGKPEVDALYRIGMDEVERGDIDKAIETFTQVIKLDPRSPRRGTSARRSISWPATSASRSPTATRSSSATRSTSARSPATRRSTSSSRTTRRRSTTRAARSRSTRTSRARAR